MNYAKLLEVPECGHHLNGETPYQPIVEALVVVHLDELIQVDRIKVKHKAKVVAPDKVIIKLDDSLHVVRVLLPQIQKKLGFNCGLVIVLLLVFDDFYRDLLLTLVVHASDHVAESSLAYHFFNFVPIADLVALYVPVVTFLIVKSVIHKPLQLRGLVLLTGASDEPHVFKVLDLCSFVIGQELICKHFAGHVSLHRKPQVALVLRRSASGVSHSHTANRTFSTRSENSASTRGARVARRCVTVSDRFARLTALASVNRIEVSLGFHELMLLSFVAEHIRLLVLIFRTLWHADLFVAR